jgi:hypothetical protein
MEMAGKFSSVTVKAGGMTSRGGAASHRGG